MLFVDALFVAAPTLANVALKPGPGVAPVQFAAVAQFMSAGPATPDQTPLPRAPPLAPVKKVQIFVWITPSPSVKMTVIVFVELAVRLFVGDQFTSVPAAL